MNKENYLNRIAQYLAELECQVKILNSINLYNINIVAEDFYAGLLNLIFDAEYKNKNVIVKNASSIDLYESKKKIAFQVTSDSSAKKIRETIDKFIKDGLYKDFNHLRILELTGKNNYRTVFNTNGLFAFNAKNDVIDNADLMNEIRSLSTDKIEEICEYLHKELHIKCDHEIQTEANEVETIIALIEYISTNKKVMATREVIVDPDYKINQRFKDFADSIKNQYIDLLSVYGNALAEIENSKIDQALDIVTRIYLQDESIKHLNQSNNDPIEALNSMIDFFASKLRVNGKKHNETAIKFYLLDKVIKCSVFPNERGTNDVS